MFPEEAHTFFSLLAGARNRRILCLLEGGEDRWKRQQPYIWTSLLGPLSLRGNEVVSRPPANEIPDDFTPFDVVLLPVETGSMETGPLTNARAALAEIERTLALDGLFVASAPGELKEPHNGPEDPLLLPTLEAWRAFLGSGWEVDTFATAAPASGSSMQRSSKRRFTSIIRAWRRSGDHIEGNRRTIVFASLRGTPIVPEAEYRATISEHWSHVEKLEEIVVESGARLEGNCFYENMTLNRPSGLLPKQRNLFSLARVCDRILEIGFNAGHSALLFLLANPNSRITCFDLCSHAYTWPCFRYLDEKFPGRLQMVPGDANQTVAEHHRQHPEPFELFHIDGGHRPKIAHTDFINCRRLATEDSIVIWDDVKIPQLGRLWERYGKGGFVLPFDMLPTPKSAHVLGTFSRLGAYLHPDFRIALS